MRGNSQWSYRPYCRLDEQDKALLPYVCALRPFAQGFELEWFDRGDATGEHILLYRKYRSPLPMAEQPLSGSVARVEGLEDGQDYEFLVKRADGLAQSTLRIVRTGQMPGVVINYLHPEDDSYVHSGRFLCSPSLVRLPGGALLASMDVFGHGSAQNLSLIFRSDDGGQNWRYVTDLMPCFWGKLFVHRGGLYMLAVSSEYGDLLISRSDDEGQTWLPPAHIFSGGGRMDVGLHKAPVPVIEHEGRLYSAVEYGNWSAGYHASGMLSIDAGADLMEAENWTLSGFTRYDSAWPGAADGFCPGGIEGNAVVSPDGTICDYLRIDLSQARPAYGKALILEIDKTHPNKAPVLHRIVDCPIGSNSKFQMRRDPVSGAYFMIGNEVVDPATPRQRNVLSLAVSEDFYNWRVVKRLIDRQDMNPSDVGFQYADWQFDGDDLMVVVRTAYNGANNYHDANCITFHRMQLRGSVDFARSMPTFLQDNPSVVPTE